MKPSIPPITATIGPVSENRETIVLLASVASRFRINTAHVDETALKARLELLATVQSQTKQTIPVVFDLQGSKVRIGRYPSVSSLPENLELLLAETSSDISVIPVPFESVFLKSCIGDLLFLNDRRVILRICEKPSDDRLLVKCIQQGELGPHKGLNSDIHTFESCRIAPGDMKAIRIGNQYPSVEYAVSFVEKAEDAYKFRELTGRHRLIAKIERKIAVKNSITIDGSFDELWFCRGDLGAETGPGLLGRYQEQFVSLFPKLRNLKFLAGEVLGSMVRSPIPSRSEMVHLHDILRTGFDGIVLSDETAIGNHLEELVGFLLEFFRQHETPDQLRSSNS